MQMDRRARLGLHQEMIGAGVGEGRKIALRLDDHQVDVERLCRRAADRLQHDRPDGDVGDEAAVHHVDVDPVGAGGVDGAHLLAQSGEIGGQNRRSDDDRWRLPALMSDTFGFEYGHFRRRHRARASVRLESCCFASCGLIDEPEKLADRTARARPAPCCRRRGWRRTSRPSPLPATRKATCRLLSIAG